MRNEEKQTLDRTIPSTPTVRLVVSILAGACEWEQGWIGREPLSARVILRRLIDDFGRSLGLQDSMHELIRQEMKVSR